MHTHTVATVYYVANFRAALALGHPMFYSKEAWVGLYLDRGGWGDRRARRNKLECAEHRGTGTWRRTALDNELLVAR